MQSWSLIFLTRSISPLPTTSARTAKVKTFLVSVRQINTCIKSWLWTGLNWFKMVSRIGFYDCNESLEFLVLLSHFKIRYLYKDTDSYYDFFLSCLYSEMSPERNVRSVWDRWRPVILRIRRTWCLFLSPTCSPWCCDLEPRILKRLRWSRDTHLGSVSFSWYCWSAMPVGWSMHCRTSIRIVWVLKSNLLIARGGGGGKKWVRDFVSKIYWKANI
jgi:hypothetical protein